MLVKRSLLFSLQYSNNSKLKFIDILAREYIFAVQYFINLFWETGKYLSYKEVKNYPYETFLSARYLGCALRQAQSIIKSLCRKRKKSKPELHSISLKLDNRFVVIEKGKNSFDFWLKLRDPINKKWISYPFKDFNYRKNNYNDWKVAESVELFKRDDKWFVKLIFKKEIEQKTKNPLGVDIGYNKLITTSDGEKFGQHLKSIIKRIANKQHGSKKQKRLKHYLKTEVNRILKSVVDGERDIVIEKLKNLKFKSRQNKRLSKTTRRLFQHWNYSYVLKRIKELCEVVGVQCHTVSSTNTSRICPQCKHVDKYNRHGELFVCKCCGFTSDADWVGAYNILMRYTTTHNLLTIAEEPIVPLSAKG